MKKRDMSKFIYDIISYNFVTICGLACLLPFITVISGSLSDDNVILREGYGLIPKGFSISAYKLVFENPTQILYSYAVSISVTLIGSIVGVFLTAMAAYVLYRKDFPYRNMLTFFIYFTTLFNGGLVATYIMMVSNLKMKNSFLALIIPLLLNPFYILVMRNFLKSIPDAVTESAKIDGAGDFTIFIKLVLPLMKPALASIGLFIALGYWNDWFSAMLYLEKEYMFPLQYLLYKMMTNFEFVAKMPGLASLPIIEIPKETLKLAMTLVAIGPIIFAYPFVQKYFIKGMTIGAVKG